MIGIIDVGGGLRGAYTSGIYDYLIDNDIHINYCIGVSAGSANLITYVAGQRDRLKRFYTVHSFEKEYMSIGNYFKKGMYIDLHYIYSDLTNSNGKDPLNFNAVMKSDKTFVAVTTDANSGEPRYFTKYDTAFDDFTLIKASCAIPIACRNPIEFKNELHFDGGVSDPIPYKKAFADGCDKVIICLTLPIDYKKKPLPSGLVKMLLRKYPKIAEKVIASPEIYANQIEEILELQREGKALILYPKECYGIKTATRELEGLNKLYDLGYEDAKKIEAFLKENREYV